MTTLFQLVKDNEELYRLFEGDEEISDDVLYSLLETCEQDINLKAARVIAFIKQLRLDKMVLNTAAREYLIREKRAGKAIDRLEDYMRMCMEGAKVDSIGTVEFGAKLLKPRASTIIDDASLLPDMYVQRVVTLNPDKNFIKQALLDGESVSGAHLEFKSPLKIV